MNRDVPDMPDSFEEMERLLLSEGYERGAPEPTRLARQLANRFGVEPEDGDEELCARTACERCGHRGMDYHPFVGEVVRHDYFTGEPRREYRAFAVCAADGCGYWHEF